MADYKYEATCHTKCYWLDNLWEPGEVYQGNEKPGKHFNQSGEAPELPPPAPVDDPRSNRELKAALLDKFDFKAPTKWVRTQIWSKLRDLELAASKDALTSGEENDFISTCGFIAKSKAGLIAHERMCDKCKGI